MVQGYIDTILFTKENNDLLTQADNLRNEITLLEKRTEGDASKITEVTALLHFAERTSMLVACDDEIFKKYVDRIVVHSRNKVEFKIKCGLNFKERM